MKYAVGLLVGVALLATGSWAENIFEYTFRKLHEEPPLPDKQNRVQVETLWIEQKLDHFNDEDKRTWQMRYMANDEHFQSGGPIFLYVGGEWEISPGRITGGLIYDMAKEHKGYLFYTEHRYYGESKPTSDLSNENLQYLHLKQALADLAHFIKTQKSTIPGLAESKVVLAGGSYSATMVTWFKKLYPELATGCWASSAPLFAKVDFIEYKEITGQSIRLMGGDNCYNRIEKGIAELEYLFAKKRGAEVKALLQLCEPFDDSNDLDIWNLFSEISDIFAGVVQTHVKGNIEGVCKKILSGSDDVTGLASYLLGVFKKSSGGAKCNDLSYKAMLKTLQNKDYVKNAIMRQWIYQTCNEYGWYQTSGSKDQPFGTKFPVIFYTTLCADAYGPKFTNEFISNQVDATNKEFGGLQPDVENVYFTHGQLDPWRGMGIQDPNNATIIPEYAHCKDFDSIKSSDTPEMRASKERLLALVREWVGSTAK